jgi:uncharacterized membrane protein YphA (DoxX/SURF4 family)
MKAPSGKNLIELISSLFILLFVYTGISKLADHHHFRILLGQSPLIRTSSAVISWMVPVVELIIAFFLLIPVLRPAALFAAMLTMMVFTGYIAYMIRFADHLPCSCGGVISRMPWNQHLAFNIFFTLLAVAGVWLTKNAKDFIAINRTSRKPV